ncbi:MAG: ABC transporter ATP-binding protein [Rhodospirillaceae bacterium]
MSEHAAIRCVGLGKRYGTVVALAEVDLRVRCGEIFGIVGENGAGKTTLIKCLLDFCEIDRGTVDILGVSNAMVHSRAVLAYLPERFNPPYYLTGTDFLRYMANLHGHRYDPTAAVATIKRLDLPTDALERPARTYSKGMAQKLALAACLLSGKDLYILDEPATGLDPRARALLKGELRSLREAGKTVFLASHALADVDALCDRIGVMHRGTLRFIGSPAEFKRHYDSSDIETAFLACTSDTAMC